MKYLSYNEQVDLRKKNGFAEFEKVAMEFSAYAAEKGIVAGDIKYCFKEKIGMLACIPNIVKLLLPCTFRDKDGLYSINALLKTMHQPDGMRGSLQADKYILLFSKFFRRGYCSGMNWTPYFVDLFWTHCIDESKECFIRFDEDRVQINLDGRRYIELDTWYGPKYNDDIEQIQDGNVKHSIPLDLSTRMKRDLFGDIKTWDLNWSTSGKMKTFQAMEFRDSNVLEDINSIKYHPVKYMHSVYDLGRQKFNHIDGAMMFLKPEEYEQRVNSDFGEKRKGSRFHPKYMKLFKVNGSIIEEDWISLVSHFFHRNYLIHEYFTGSFPERIQQHIDEYRCGTGFYR